MSRQNKESTGKGSKFFSGRGFYIALILCVAAIGISCYYLYNSLSNIADLSTPAENTVVAGYELGLGSGADPMAAPEEPLDSEPEPGAESGGAEAVSGSAEVILPVEPEPEPEPEPAAPVSAPPTETANIFVWPCAGFVLKGYSAGELVFNRSTGDWRTHNGIDVAADVGTHVLAINDGTVTAVETDTMEGTCVTIDHGDGLVSRYIGLQSVPTVQAGDPVMTGDVIGAIGTTALAETVETPHLHFELSLNGYPVDPTEYLPQGA